MTVKKGNFLEFVFIQPVSAGDATTVSGDQTFRVAPATIYKRADGSYYDLNFNNDATISLSQLRGTIVTSDGTVEVVGVSSIASAGTTSDGRRQYDLTFETSSDASKLLRGIKQDDDGTNAVANRDDDLVIGTVSIGDKFKIAWDVAEANGLEDTFEASVAETVNKYVQFQLYSKTTPVSVTDGRAYFVVPAGYNAHNLSAVSAVVITAGTTGTTDIQIHNETQAVDMLSTKLTIDSGETSSATAATPVVIDPANDDVATGDLIRVDIDAVSTTPPEGMVLSLTFTNPI